MSPLGRLVLRSLLATAWLLVSPSFAGTKLDLSPYLGNVGQQGDFRVFDRSTGGQRTVTMLELQAWKKGWQALFSSVTTGAGEDFDGTVIYEDFLIPGKQLLSGSDVYDNGMTFFVRKPSKSLKLQGTPGKPQRINQKALAIFDGFRIGSVARTGTWSIDGFETVATPSGSYAQALRAQASSKVRVRLIGGAVGCSNGVCGNELVQMSHRTLWYAEGLGLVRANIEFEAFANGTPAEEAAWSEELSSGRSDGVPFP